MLPRLRRLPGFRHAMFLAGAEGSGMSVLVFATRRQAEGLAARLASGQVPPPAGVRFVGQEVHEVVASADAAADEGDAVLHWARAYDVLVGVLTLGRERRFRAGLVDLAGLQAGWSVLDVGCGTGTMALAAQERVGPGGRVCGVDASPEMVDRARAKAAKTGSAARFEVAPVEALPFEDGAFDAVTSTLMLHHLSDDGRRGALAEVARVLKPGGRFLGVDIGGGSGRFHAAAHRLAPRHADFDLTALGPALQEAGLRVVDDGPVPGRAPVGLSNLRFVLAEPA